MSPIRAFLFSFTAGLSLMFSGYSLIAVAMADTLVSANAPVA